MKQNNVKNTYTGIIRLRDKISRNGKKYKIIVISEIKLIGSNKDKYDLIWARETPEFKYLGTDTVAKFDAQVSEERNLKYLTKSNIFDIEELKKIPHLIDLTNITHLDKEKDNKRIKIRLCLKCGAIIYYKEMGRICGNCRQKIDISKRKEQKRKEKGVIKKNKSKTCRVCGKTYLKVTHFINSKRSKDGYSSKCVYC